MQSLHGKCLRRTKAARVKSDSGNRHLAPLCGCLSLAVLLLPALLLPALLLLLPIPRCSSAASPGRDAHALRSLAARLNIPFPPSLPLSLASPPCPSGRWLCWSELDLPSSPLLPFCVAKGLVKVVDVSQK